MNVRPLASHVPASNPHWWGVQVLPIDRGAGLQQQGMQAAQERLSRGDWVHVFPEGTRSADGRVGQAKRGVGRLIAACDRPPLGGGACASCTCSCPAAALGIPVHPCQHAYTQAHLYAFARGRVLKLRRDICVQWCLLCILGWSRCSRKGQHVPKSARESESWWASP